MNINLRKANAVQEAIRTAIADIPVEIEIHINEFQRDSISHILDNANNELFANDFRRQSLLMALYNIRALVAAANSANINTHLTRIAFLDKRIEQLRQLIPSAPMVDRNIIAAKLAKIAESGESLRWAADSVVTSVLSAEQISDIKNEISNLKKQKQELSDELLEFNITTTIPLTDEVSQLLQTEGIL